MVRDVKEYTTWQLLLCLLFSLNNRKTQSHSSSHCVGSVWAVTYSGNGHYWMPSDPTA